MDWLDNLDEINALVHRAARISLTDATQGTTLGDELLDIAALRVIERTIAEQVSPDGSPLAANADNPSGKGYRSRKVKAGIAAIGIGIGETQGDMLSMVQVRGRRTIEPDSAEMEYGTDDEQNRKGQWFTAGSESIAGLERSGAEDQPPRPFYGLDDEARRRMIERARERLAERIAGLGGGT